MKIASTLALPRLFLPNLIIILFIINQPINAQNAELSTGINYHSFFDLQEQNPHFQSSYESQIGPTISLGISKIKYEFLTLALDLDYSSYGGTLSVTDGGLGGSFSTKGLITKSRLGVTLFPLCLNLPKKIEFRLGINASFLMDEEFTGIRSGWLMGSPEWSLPFSSEDTEWSSKTTWEARGMLQYPILINDDWSMIAEYRFCLGLSSEFSTFTKETRSMKHELLFGLSKKL